MAAQVEVQTGEVGRPVAGGRLHLSPLTDSSNKSVGISQMNQSHIITPELSKPAPGPKPRLTPKPFVVEKNPTIKPILAPKPQAKPRPESTRLAGPKPEFPSSPKPQQPLPSGKPRQVSSNINRPAPTTYKASTKLNTSHTIKPVVQPFKPVIIFDPKDLGKPSPPVPTGRKNTGPRSLAYSKSLKKFPVAEWPRTTKKEDENGQGTMTRAKSMGSLNQVCQEEEEEKEKAVASVPLRPQTRTSRPRPVSAIFLDNPSKTETPVPVPRWGGRRPLSADLTSKFESVGLSLHRKSPAANTKENTPEQMTRPEAKMSPDDAANPTTPADQSDKNTVEKTTKEADESRHGGSIKSRISLLLDSSCCPSADATSQGSDLNSPVQLVTETEPQVGVKQLIKQLTEDVIPTQSPIMKPALKPRPLPLDLTKRFSTERSPDLGSASLSEAVDCHEISKDPQRMAEESPITHSEQWIMDLTELLKRDSTPESPQTLSFTSEEGGPASEAQTVRASVFENVVERHSVLVVDDTKPVKKDLLSSSSFKRKSSEDDGTVVTATYKEPVAPSSPLRVAHAFDTVQAVVSEAVSENIPAAQWEDKAMTLRSRRSEGSRVAAEMTGSAHRDPVSAATPEQHPRYLRVGALQKWTTTSFDKYPGMSKETLQESQREEDLVEDRDKQKEAEKDDVVGETKRLKRHTEEQPKPKATYFALTAQIQDNVSPADLGINKAGMTSPFDNFSTSSLLGSSQGKILSVRRNPSLDEALGKPLKTQDQVEESMMRSRMPPKGIQLVSDGQLTGDMMEVEKNTEAKMKESEREKPRQLVLEQQAQFAKMKEIEMQREFVRQRHKERKEAEEQERQKREREKAHKQEKERQERQRQKEEERQRELDRQKHLLELQKEKQKREEMERQQLLEFEKQKQKEKERQQAMELEQQMQREKLEREKAEKLKQAALEQEMLRIREIEKEKERQKEMERERQRQKDLERERQQQLDIERQELENQRLRQEELEKERQRKELERQQRIEFEKQKQKEKERQQAMELEQQMQREKVEREKAEHLKQAALEQEMLRIREIEKEKERQKEMERERQRQKDLERERQRQLDIERQELENQRLRQEELEKERQRKELEAIKEMERRQLLEFEKQKQAEKDRQAQELERRLREMKEREEAEKMRQVAKQQEAERKRMREKQERSRSESSALRPKVVDLDSVFRNEPVSQAAPPRSDPSTRWKEPSPRTEESYKPAILDIDSFTSQTQVLPSKDLFPVSNIPGVDSGLGSKLQHTPDRDVSWKVPPQTSGSFSSPIWTSPQDPWQLWSNELSVDKPVVEPRKYANKVGPEQLLIRQEEQQPTPQRHRSTVRDELLLFDPFSPTKTGSPPSVGLSGFQFPVEVTWLPKEPQRQDSRTEVQKHGRSQDSRMRSRSMSRRSAPSASTLDGNLPRIRSRSAHREQERHSWVQEKQSDKDEKEEKDSETPVHDTDSQYGTWETGLRTDDSLTPATPTSESNLSPSPRKPTPPHTPGEHGSQPETDTPDSLLPSSPNQPLSFPDAPSTLLDNSVLRTRAQLAKKRAPRARPSRAARQSAALAGGEGASAEDWLYRDSTEAKVESKNDDSDSEEQNKEADVSPAVASQPQRVALFPGMDPSALKAQLRKRGDSDNQIDGAAPSPSQPSRSPKSPFLPRAARVLPAPGGKENDEEDSPQWLKELKSKKRLSQYESES